MNYEKSTRFNDAEFKRLVGVPCALFAEMLVILQQSKSVKKKSGRPHSLTIEDQLLLTLKYLRPYRTQIELSADFGLAESNVNRTIQKIKKSLSQSRNFALPKRNQDITKDDYVIIDVTESQIECPKKTGKILQW